MRSVLALCLSLVGCAQILGLEDPKLSSNADAGVRPDSAPPPDAPPPVTLTITHSGTGGGSVRSSPDAIDCGSTCSATFQQGAIVTLVAIANGGSSFVTLGAPCSGEATCRLTLDADTTVDVTFTDNSSGHNFVFVTKEFYAPSSLLPLSNADDDCNASAADAGLPGKYVAWVSSMAANAKDRIPSTARGWVRPDGLPFGDRLADILALRTYYPPMESASGGLVQFEYVMTGTDQNGMALADLDCKEWSSADENDTGSMQRIDGAFIAEGTTKCGDVQPLLCFGIDHNKAVSAPTAPMGSRIAFASQGTLPVPLGTLANADEVCQSEATANSLPGTYKALLATQGASAASRFDGTKGSWVRPDGVVLALPGTSILDSSTLAAPINVTAAGTYLGVIRTATGATSPTDPGTAQTTCKNWTSSDSGDTHLVGHVHITRNWFNTFSTGCNEYCVGCLALFCLQQ